MRLRLKQRQVEALLWPRQGRQQVRMAQRHEVLLELPRALRLRAPPREWPRAPEF